MAFVTAHGPELRLLPRKVTSAFGSRPVSLGNAFGHLRPNVRELRTVPVYELMASVFLCQHDGNDALGNG